MYWIIAYNDCNKKNHTDPARVMDEGFWDHHTQVLLIISKTAEVNHKILGEES